MPAPYYQDRVYQTAWGASLPTTLATLEGANVVANQYIFGAAGWVLGAAYLRDLMDGGNHLAWLAPTPSGAFARVARFYRKTAGPQHGNDDWEHTYFHSRYPVIAGSSIWLMVWFQSNLVQYTPGRLTNGPVTSGDITVPQSTAQNPNGLEGGSAVLIPNINNGDSMYGIDILFSRKR